MTKISIWLTCLLFVNIGIANAQLKIITGQVTSDNTNQPIAGVTVTIPKSTIGTTTDINGYYKLNVDVNTVFLRFSYLNMKTQDIILNGRTIVNIKMQTAIEELDEVIVTALGISRKNKAIGYSVEKIKDVHLENNGEPDLIRNLAGKISGVNIISSGGMPGSSTRITIRGNSSFLRDNQPLFIVDGIPYSNQNFITTSLHSGGGAYASGISTLDPNNIKSITVLKGIAAATLYGSRAANGVILVKTKTGNVNETDGTKITISSSIASETISSLPDYQNTYGAGSNFVYGNLNGSWGPKFDELYEIPTWPMYLKAFPEIGKTIPYIPQPDNVKNLFRTGVVTENIISILNGGETASLGLTASLLNNKGYIPHSSFNRKSISIGGNTKLFNRIILNGNLSYSKSKQIGGRFGDNQSLVEGTASSFARTLWLARNWNMYLPYTHLKTGESLTPNGPGQFDNPLWSWKHNTITTNVDRIVANISLSYDITNYLKVKFIAGTNTFIQNRQEIIDIGSKAVNGKGSITTDNVRTNEFESTLLITLNKKLSKDFKITANFGGNLNQYKLDRKSFYGTELIADGVYNIQNTKNIVPNGAVNHKRRLWGLFNDITLSYKNYLYLNFAGRNDWSSTLPLKNNSFFYPSISASFIITDAFDIKSDILNFAKIRAGWTKVGYDANPYLIHETFITRRKPFPFNGQAAQTVPNTLTDANLHPEFTKEFEIGTNIALFNNQLRIDVSWYSRTSSDQITKINIPSATGYKFFYTNIGELKNTGWEIGLKLNPINKKNGLKWNIYTNFTKNTSKVTKLPKGYTRIKFAHLLGNPSAYLEIGKPYGILRGSVNARDKAGNLLVDPATGLLIPSKEKDIIADPNPDFRIGLTNIITYKKFDLNIQINYTHGGDFYSSTISNLLGNGVTKDTEDREDSYVIPGVYGDPNTGLPLLNANGNTIPNNTKITKNDLYYGNSFGINAAKEWGVYDATVLRLSNLSLAYNIPQSILGKLPISSLKLIFSGRNLWFYTPNLPKHVNIDPEFNGYANGNVQGVENANAPSVKRYSLKLIITL
jgi:TonB-linked SusC/RagA family outer membrane protein